MTNKSVYLALLQLLRPQQWIKNSFVAAPLIFAGEFLNTSSIQAVLLAVVLFCLGSSATYIVNDIRDIERDRAHPIKSKKRPLAAGHVNKAQALGLLAVLYLLLIGGFLLLPKVMLVIVGYLLLNVAYSYVLKYQPVIDIFTIAAGFVLRVYAGALAIEVPVSSWMFVTTLCLALYIAAIKRRQELNSHGSKSREVLKKYSVSLVDRYAEMSATGALLFYSLFIMTVRPELLVTLPFVLFGLFRYWYVIDALDGGESPTDALFSDWQLMLTVCLWIAVSVWATWPANSP